MTLTMEGDPFRCCASIRNRSSSKGNGPKNRRCLDIRPRTQSTETPSFQFEDPGRSSRGVSTTQDRVGHQRDGVLPLNRPKKNPQQLSRADPRGEGAKARLSRLLDPELRVRRLDLANCSATSFDSRSLLQVERYARSCRCFSI